MTAIRAPFRIRGGVHPHDSKSATSALPVETAAVPPRLLVSASQHLGAPSKPVVKKGDAVLRGQVIAEASGYVSSAVHAPTSGTVKSVTSMLTATARHAFVVEIEPDGQDKWVEPLHPMADWTSAAPRDLVNRIAAAGIVGMGGAGFPTQVKLSPPPGKSIDTVIINGAECEPFLTADHRLMLEQSDAVWLGARIIRHILGASRLFVGIEDNKPDAIAAMEKAMAGADGETGVIILKSRYPQGAEKQLIRSVTGREVPSGGLPMDVGAVVENVATAAAVAAAVTRGVPLTERVITITGECVKNPRNLLARVGTPISWLIEQCGGLTGSVGKVISGGPMMGVALPDLDVGANKTTSGVLAISRESARQFGSEPCIACGRCVIACPSGLLPCTLSEHIEAEQFDDAERISVLDCIECGACAFECPARRPLVQHMRQGKQTVLTRRRAREAAARGKEERK
ncbi:MAG: electron transport complex subunit RsxC [Lentisphaerae bacterium]|nr:electron transport complex subunit RsxC [Lentisphaerota bacterium]